MTDALRQIEERRRAAGISQEKLAVTAGSCAYQYRCLLKEVRPVNRAVLSRLATALARLAKAGNTPTHDAHVIYRLCLILVSFSRGADPASVLAADPALRATADADWMAAAEIRRKAMYLAHVACGLSQRDVARAAGLTPAAVSQAMGAIEDARDDTEDDPLISMVETALGAE